MSVNELSFCVLVSLAPPADVQICHNEEKISWRQCGWDERSRALSYVVYMRESDSKDWRKVTEEHVDRKNNFCILCPFKNMKDHTLYTFKIVARNEKGESEPVETEQLMKKSSMFIYFLQRMKLKYKHEKSIADKP